MCKPNGIRIALVLFVFGSASGGAVDMGLRDPTQPLGYTRSAKSSDPLILQALFLGGGRKEAIVSGVSVKEGDRVRGRRVLSIKQNSIVIESASGPTELRLRSSIFSK